MEAILQVACYGKPIAPTCLFPLSKQTQSLIIEVALPFAPTGSLISQYSHFSLDKVKHTSVLVSASFRAVVGNLLIHHIPRASSHLFPIVFFFLVCDYALDGRKL